jgi:hypothetical protein
MQERRISRGWWEQLYAAIAAGENQRALEMIHDSGAAPHLMPPQGEARLQARIAAGRQKELAL